MAGSAQFILHNIMELGAKMGLDLLSLFFDDNGDVSRRDVAEGQFYHVIDDPFFA